MTIEAQKGDRPPIINPIFVGAGDALSVVEGFTNNNCQ